MKKEMMKKRRFLSMIMVLLMVLTMSTAMVFAEDGEGNQQNTTNGINTSGIKGDENEDKPPLDQHDQSGNDSDNNNEDGNDNTPPPPPDNSNNGSDNDQNSGVQDLADLDVTCVSELDLIGVSDNSDSGSDLANLSGINTGDDSEGGLSDAGLSSNDQQSGCDGNHDWGETTYDFDEVGMNCTATRVCKKDPSHTESVTEVVKSIFYINASCTEGKRHQYHFTFRDTDWAEKQWINGEEYSDPLGHDYDWENPHTDIPATGTEDGLISWMCKRDNCGHILEQTVYMEIDILPEDGGQEEQIVPEKTIVSEKEPVVPGGAVTETPVKDRSEKGSTVSVSYAKAASGSPQTGDTNCLTDAVTVLILSLACFIAAIRERRARD